MSNSSVIVQNFENYFPTVHRMYTDLYVNSPENENYNPDYVHSGTKSVCSSGKASSRGAFSLFDEGVPALEIGKKYTLQIYVKPVSTFFESSVIYLRHCPLWEKCRGDAALWQNLDEENKWGQDKISVEKFHVRGQLEIIAKTKELKFNEWNLISYEFTARAPYIGIQVPERSVIAFDDCTITKKADKTAEDSFSLNGNADFTGYKIVMPKYNLSYIVGRELKNLSQVFDEYNDSFVPVVTDRETKGEKEIIISDFTDRGNAANLNDRDDWQITVKDGKVFIEGGYNYSNAIAVLEFIKLIKAKKALKDGDVIKGKYSETIKDYDENYYRPVLQDNFDNDTLNDKMLATYYEDLTHAYSVTEGWKAILRPENSYIKDGKFVGFASYDKDKKEYYGARLSSKDRVYVKYGLIEISCIIPTGGGYWSSFWLNGPDRSVKNSIEIDMFEQFSPGDCIKQSILVHGGGTPIGGVMSMFDRNYLKGQNQKTYYFLPEGELFSDTFHTIGCEYDETTCRMLVDGQVLYEVDYSSNKDVAEGFAEYMRIIVGLTNGHEKNAQGIYMPRPKSNTDNTSINMVTPIDLEADYWEKTNKYIIDYIHVYQKAGQSIKFI